MNTRVSPSTGITRDYPRVDRGERATNVEEDTGDDDGDSHDVGSSSVSGVVTEPRPGLKIISTGHRPPVLGTGFDHSQTIPPTFRQIASHVICHVLMTFSLALLLKVVKDGGITTLNDGNGSPSSLFSSAFLTCSDCSSMFFSVNCFMIATMCGFL